jgi:hypothetical protein
VFRQVVHTISTVPFEVLKPLYTKINKAVTMEDMKGTKPSKIITPGLFEQGAVHFIAQ